MHVYKFNLKFKCCFNTLQPIFRTVQKNSSSVERSVQELYCITPNDSNLEDDNDNICCQK